MPQQSVARPGERRAEKEQKEIERHCAVECRGPWPALKDPTLLIGQRSQQTTTFHKNVVV